MPTLTDGHSAETPSRGDITLCGIEVGASVPLNISRRMVAIETDADPDR